MIPKNFQDWKECIKNKCNIIETIKINGLYGKDHLNEDSKK